MYSVILAALITTGTEQNQAWHCHGCHSCYSSCYCGGCSGCWGGCWGYAYGGCSCYGCYGGCSCYGYSCSGCSCYGPALWTAGYSHWCTGCYGSWCSGYAGSGWSYYGGPAYLGGICSGVCSGVCYGGYAGVTTAPVPYASTYSTPSVYANLQSTAPAITQVAQASTASGASPSPAPGSEFQTVANRVDSDASPARVVVNLPADAKLWVDQVACPLKGETRSFNTATLQPGSRYFYNLTVETAQGARETRRIEMAPGRTTEVDFRSFASVQR